MTMEYTGIMETQIVGSGVSTLSIVWPFLSRSDGTHQIEVTKTLISSGVDVVLVEDTDYTVALDGASPNTGVITFVVAPTSLYRITVIPKIDKTNSFDLPSSGIVDVNLIEREIDRLTLVNKEFEAKLDKVVSVTQSTVSSGFVLPDPSLANAGDIVKINAAKDGFEYIAPDEAVSVSAFDITALTIATPDPAADYFPFYDTSAGALRKGLQASDGLQGQIKDIKIANVTAAVTIAPGTAYTWVDATGLTVTTTPSATNERVLLMGTISIGANTFGNVVYYRIKRSDGKLIVPKTTTDLREPVIGSKKIGGVGESMDCLPILAIDEEVGTTSALTYQVQLAFSTSNTYYLNRTTTDTDGTTYSRAVSQFFCVRVN